jgi:arylsulfatase A-like enzyme
MTGVGRTPSPSTFWQCLWLAVVLFAAKAVHWSLPEPSLKQMREYATDLAVSTHADLAFAACLGLFAAALMRAAGERARLRTAIWVAFLALCVVSGVYAVASVQIFAYLRSPLTYALLYAAGDFKNMRSSLGSFLTPGFVAALVAAPLFQMIAGHVSRSWRRPRLAWLVLAAVAAQFAFGRHALAGRWSDRDDRLISASPHVALVTSIGRELLGLSAERFDEEFPETYRADFTPAPSPTPRAVGARPRNLIVVVLESTGAQFLGLYGSPYPTTPNLDREAAHALVFDSHYAHVGMSANTLASLLLSLYPYMTWREYTVEYPHYPGATLANVLGPAGFRSAFLYSGDLAYVNQREFLEGRGFDITHDHTDFGCEMLASSWGCQDRYLIDATLRFVDESAGDPFFVFAWSSGSHHPYEPDPQAPFVDYFAGQPPADNHWDLGRYLNTLAEADRQLGRLFDGLRERGLAEDTLVVVTGDHGEAFGVPHDTWGHGTRLFEENVRVPLMLWNPRLFEGNERAGTIGGHVDLNPTLADLMGVAPHPSWRGRSLFAPERPPRAYFYAANGDYMLGVREGNWKYVYNATIGREDLFDLASDPDEQVNRASEHPELCRTLRQRLAAWRATAAEDLTRARETTALSAR